MVGDSEYMRDRLRRALRDNLWKGVGFRMGLGGVEKRVQNIYLSEGGVWELNKYI